MKKEYTFAQIRRQPTGSTLKRALRRLLEDPTDKDAIEICASDCEEFFNLEQCEYYYRIREGILTVNPEFVREDIRRLSWIKDISRTQEILEKSVNLCSTLIVAFLMIACMIGVPSIVVIGIHSIVNGEVFTGSIYILSILCLYALGRSSK